MQTKLKLNKTTASPRAAHSRSNPRAPITWRPAECPWRRSAGPCAAVPCGGLPTPAPRPHSSTHRHNGPGKHRDTDGQKRQQAAQTHRHTHAGTQNNIRMVRYLNAHAHAYTTAYTEATGAQTRMRGACMHAVSACGKASWRGGAATITVERLQEGGLMLCGGPREGISVLRQQCLRLLHCDRPLDLGPQPRSPAAWRPTGSNGWRRRWRRRPSEGKEKGKCEGAQFGVNGGIGRGRGKCGAC